MSISYLKNHTSKVHQIFSLSTRTRCAFRERTRRTCVVWTQVGKARCESPSPVRRVVGRRSASLSPTRGGLGWTGRTAISSSSAATAAAGLEAALEQRRRQLGELRGRVSCAEERATNLRQRADSADTKRRRLQHDVDTMKQEREHMSVVVRKKIQLRASLQKIRRVLYFVYVDRVRETRTARKFGESLVGIIRTCVATDCIDLCLNSIGSTVCGLVVDWPKWRVQS